MTQTELEAAAFRRLVTHLQERTDVQNIDLMNLAGFCRNCLSKWYAEAASESGQICQRTKLASEFTGCPMTSGKLDIKHRFLRGSRFRDEDEAEASKTV